MKPDKIYIIHYTKLKQRRDYVVNILEKYNIPYEFITDYDQEELNYDILSKFYDIDPIRCTTKVDKTYKCHVPFNKLNIAEISCTIKHLIAIKKLSLECPNFGLILEDDIIINNFEELYEKYIKQTPLDWEAIFLGEGCGIEYQKENIKKRSKQVSDNVFLMSHPATNCAEAYMMKPEIASKIYKSAVPFNTIIDFELACQFDIFHSTIYWWYPSFISQGSKNNTYKSTLR